MSQQALIDWVRRLPKAELHLHIEGSLEPQMVFDLAKRNGVSLDYPTVEALKAAYDFDSLQAFLDVYYAGMSVLLNEADFYAMTQAYCQRAVADGVRHVEVFFDPQGHTERGVELSVVVEGILRALKEAQAQWDLSYQLIPNFLRHLSEESAIETFDALRPWYAELAGFGLDSSELGHPPEKFARVFALCREAGFKVTAHAGEEGPPEYVWQALKTLQVDRIDHGNRALEDVQLVDHLRQTQMPLTVCPLSNLKLCVVDDLKNHPLPQMLQQGLKPLVNSDDPAYFGGYLMDNFVGIIENLALSPADLLQLVRNSLDAAWLSEARRKTLLSELDQWVDRYPTGV